MTEEKKPKRTLNNTPASEWGPMDDDKVINSMLKVLAKAPESRQRRILSATSQEFDAIEIRRHNGGRAAVAYVGIKPDAESGSTGADTASGQRSLV